MSTGLYIGKLAPMHLGHELIIRRMLGECDRGIVFIYNSLEFERANPQLTKVVRGYWVEQRYPNAEVILGFNPPPDDSGVDGDRIHTEYIARHLTTAQQPDFLYGAEPWVDTMAPMFGAQSRRNERDGQGISASKIRANPAEYAWYMQPMVRDWMLENYPSTGLHV